MCKACLRILSVTATIATDIEQIGTGQHMIMAFIFLVDKCTPNEDMVSFNLYVHIYLRNYRKCSVGILFSVSLLKFVERIYSLVPSSHPKSYEDNSKINLRLVGKKKRVVIATKRTLSSNK